jgi:HSP20 family protein
MNGLPTTTNLKQEKRQEASIMFTLIPYRNRYGNDLSKRANSLFDNNIFRPFFDVENWMGNTAFRVDIKDKENEYLLEAELPGIPEDQISLSVENDMLTISAESKYTDEESRYYSERRYGHEERSFSLENIAQDGIKADYKNGILYVTLPKAKPEPKKVARSIAINLGEGKETKKLG